MAGSKTKGMRIATRCASVDQFVAVFHRFVDGETFFVSTTSARPVGVETAFSIDLADGGPVLRGICVILEAWPTADGPFKRPGVRLGIQKLTAVTAVNWLQLKAAARAAQPPPIPVAARVPVPPPAPTEERVAGSDLVLPANPLMNISDQQLEGFVDCTLYEETGSYFRAAAADEDAGDPPVDPPLLAPRRAITQGSFEITPLPPPPLAPEPELPAVVYSPLPVDVRPPPAPISVSFDAMPRRRWRRLPTKVTAKLREPRWLVGGGAGILLLVILVTALSTGGRSSKAADRPAPPPAAVTAAITPPPAAAPAPVPAPEVDTDAKPDTGGTPVVGSGPCKVTIATTPAGSIVSVDDQSAGPSPIIVAGACSKHKIDIAHARYQPATRWVALAADKPQTLDIALARPTHAVMINSSPLGATISIEGHRAGTTPTVIDVMGFSTVTLKIEKVGYQSVTKKLYSTKPSDRLFVKLQK